ncbi:CFAH factor, partial [Nothocercus julius]|nr:CFAH factor [Nothocercus julius]
ACEEPPPRRIKELPTETWDKPPYPHGTQVTYKCRPGYIKVGRIVLECIDGAWEQPFQWAECRSKPCGHPGDIQFGSFELTAGNEFVFGARVEYRCDEGYQMLSLKNYRECQADGWSNDVPHCEVAKCLPVQAPANGRIIVTGVFELDQEFSFGQVVKFECNANYKLVGSKEVHCSSNGKWSSDVPQCQETTCDRPEIQHGYVESPKASYKKSERLRYSCNKGYRYGDRAEAECTEFGWTPTPYCTEIICLPPRIPNGNFRLRKDVYREGEEITIDCNSGYHFKVVTSQNTAQCTKAGWVPSPECVTKPCDYPVIENGELSEALRLNAHMYFPMGIGQQVDYHCHDGYSPPNGGTWVRIRCSAWGWWPEPECHKICRVTQLENGAFLSRQKYVYKESEKAKYSCSTDYAPENEHGQVTCTKNDWSPPPRCIRKSEHQSEKDLDCHRAFDRVMSKQNKALSFPMLCHSRHPWYECKFKITCDIENPEATAQKYHYLYPNVQIHLLVFLKSFRYLYLYLSDSLMHKYCFFSIPYAFVVFMLHVKTFFSFFTAIECEMPILPNGEVSPKADIYRNGAVVEFACAADHVRVGTFSAQCYYFGWFPSPPICKVDPKGCSPPSESVNGSILGDFEEQYRHGDRTEYECNENLKMVGSKEIECVDGQWSPPPFCIEDKTPCGSPPSGPNVSLYRQNQAQFSHGAEVTYKCKRGTESYGQKKTKCLNGEWKPLPFCGDPSQKCSYPLDIEIMNTENVPWPNKQTELHEVIRYTCKPNSSNIKKATCIFGKWSPEIECLAEKLCPPPPQLPGAQQIPVERNYRNGSKVTFSCLKNFQLDGVNEITCIDGKWQSPPRCIERPCLAPQSIECAEDPTLENSSLSVEKQGKTTYLAGAKFKYVPRSGFVLDGHSEITCSMGTWTSSPTCTDVTCRAPPAVHGASFASSQAERYLPGARVQYECESNFQIVGVNYIICTNGQWSQPPTC